MQIRKEHRVTYKEVSRYPAVRRDLSLLVSDGTSFDRLKQLASHAETRILKEVSIFDKYTPKNDQQGRLADGKKSYALRFVLRDDEKTLKRSEEHTYELQSLIRKSYAVICL